MINRYQLFLFDQFGVLHNGTSAYSGMRTLLLSIKKHGKTVGVISNSGKSAAINAERLERFGYGSDAIDRVWTSGELTWRTLNSTIRNNSDGRKKRIFYLGNDDDRSALRNLPILEVEKPDLADVIIIAGMGQTLETRGNYKALFQKAAFLRVPAYCSNPDLLTFQDDKNITDGPGSIAKLYQQLGGPCEYFGKPHIEIYQSIFEDTGIAANQTVCIGDSLYHDIEGAAVAGCDSVLVSTGVYENMSDAEFNHKLATAQYQPTYLYGDRGDFNSM